MRFYIQFYHFAGYASEYMDDDLSIRNKIYSIFYSEVFYILDLMAGLLLVNSKLNSIYSDAFGQVIQLDINCGITIVVSQLLSKHCYNWVVQGAVLNSSNYYTGQIYCFFDNSITF